MRQFSIQHLLLLQQVLMLVLYNARKNTTVATLELGSVKSWISELEQYAYKTFFSVTAGDYDGDGVDEIACTDGNMDISLVDIEKEIARLIAEGVDKKLLEAVKKGANYVDRKYIEPIVNEFK